TGRDRLRRAPCRSSCAFSSGHARLPERVSQSMHGGMKLPLHRALGEAERLRDLAQLHTLMMPHHEHDPLTFRQAANLTFKDLSTLAAIGALFGSGGFFWGVQHSLFRFITKGRAGTEALTPPVIDAGVHDDSIEPRGQLCILPEPVE